ncbi:hypothetical protein AZI87_15490 [Bdellovibrio bacteriovorus]|uniref:Uncharacterized protein n=1 Tax=Bdellovibrio bacteriovorus TaxID=959 RepID=A0A150WKU1_BDEBC|nr:hypothetical protein [Bdellovibrio bacteriovorus]KYG62689.1 hypothetical protein AZI87_15490 [Bdellovibrio bacteriovorus]KYG64538.1 hypothetical protein AZI85_03755 [Bdellovibrio bacteriovorus]
MNKILFLFVLCASVSAMALGGDVLGNGGDAVVCPAEGGIKTVEALDLHESRELRKFTYIDAANAAEALRTVFKNLEEKDPSRACLFGTWMEEFTSQSKFVYGKIPRIFDEGPVYVRPRCFVYQAIVRYDQVDADGKRYFINGDLFTNMDALNQIAMVLHELVYREAKFAKGPLKNTTRVRRYTGYIFSTRLKSDSPEAYRQFLEDSNLSSDEDYCDANHRIYQKTH